MLAEGGTFWTNLAWLACVLRFSLSVHSFVFLTEDDETERGAEALQTVFLSGCQGKPGPAKGSAAQALLFISFIPADERHSLISLIVQGFFCFFPCSASENSVQAFIVVSCVCDFIVSLLFILFPLSSLLILN